MSRNLTGLILIAFIAVVPVFADDANDVNAVDMLIGLPDVNVVDANIISITYDANDYVVETGDLTLGTTTRWYIDANDTEIHWVDGDPAPAATTNSSSPKESDIGANADNYRFPVGWGDNGFSSLDGINFQKTLFPTTSNIFFILERGGNDKGNMQAIYADGTLGEEIAFNKAPYANTGQNANGSNAFGVVFKTVEPAIGVRINAPGHDCIHISIPTPDAYLTGLPDVNVVDYNIVSISYGDTDYVVADGDLTLGTTTRWYIDSNDIETHWVDGDPAPAATTNSSSPKESDIGANADNYRIPANWGDNGFSSIDGINFQKTIFDVPSDIFFILERGGNDAGDMQPILLDGSLGDPVPFKKANEGGPYANTGVNANGSKAYGVVFKTHGPIQGIRINAPGHDCIHISVPTPVEEEPTPAEE